MAPTPPQTAKAGRYTLRKMPGRGTKCTGSKATTNAARKQTKMTATGGNGRGPPSAAAAAKVNPNEDPKSDQRNPNESSSRSVLVTGFRLELFGRTPII